MSDKCVLCGDETVLPQLCIVSGRALDLVSQSAKLKWRPWFFSVPAFVMLSLICLSVGFSALSQLGGAPPGAARSEADLAMTVAFSVAGFAAFLVLLSFRLTTKISVTWYIQRQILIQRDRRSRRWLMCAMICGAIAAGLVANFVRGADILVMCGLLLGLISAWCVTASRQKIRPVFAGQHNGLNVLIGLSPLFLERVQEMIDRRSRRQRG